MQLQSLITFKKIIDEASYSRAAAALFISQPSASQHVRQLERFFSARLIETSSGRNPHMTEAGKAVYELASNLEHELQETKRRVTDALGQDQRIVTIVTNTSPLLHRLPPIIRRFLSEQPEVGVRTLRRNGGQMIIDTLKSGDADVGIQTNPKLDKSLEAVEAWRDWIIPVSASDHSLADIQGIPLQEIARRTVLVSISMSTRVVIDNWFKSHGVTLQDVVEVPSFEHVRVAALAGLGIGLLPSYIVVDDLESGALRPLDIEVPYPWRSTYVVFPSSVGEHSRRIIEMILESSRGSAEELCPPELPRSAALRV